MFYFNDKVKHPSTKKSQYIQNNNFKKNIKFTKETYFRSLVQQAVRQILPLDAKRCAI